MIVDSALYRAGVRTDTVADPGDLAALRSHAVEPGDFVWVGVFEPSDAELEDVGRVFGLHPLALEDARESHQRPKLETYGDCLFLVLKTLWYVDEEDAVETGEVNLFIGPDFVVSVRHGDGAELRRVRERVEAQPHVLTHGPSAVAWAVCDVAVDDYLDVTDELVTDVDEVEESVFSTDRTQDSTRIYTLKRELAEVRRAVHPLSEPMRRLASGEVPGVHEQVRPFFRDVLDHIQHTGDVVESLESLLSSAFDAHLARLSLQQNDDMRKISAGAALVVVPTLIAGIYGMNFPLWPDGGWAGGFWFAIALMGASIVALWVAFKRTGWF